MFFASNIYSLEEYSKKCMCVHKSKASVVFC